MTMGWCLSCHRDVREEQREAPVPIATLAENRLALAVPGPTPPRHLTPPTDCSACHR